MNMIAGLNSSRAEEQFFPAMQEIQAARAGGNMSMLELREVLQRKSGVDLTSFWNEWVLRTGRPWMPNLIPGDLCQQGLGSRSGGGGRTAVLSHQVPDSWSPTTSLTLGQRRITGRPGQAAR